VLDWTFELNNQPMSAFKHGAISFPAFSGLGEHVNRRISPCLANEGHIPPGTYYIVDRQNGGLLRPLYDMFGRHSDWFALYAIDGTIDDQTYCDRVKVVSFACIQKVHMVLAKGALPSTVQRTFSI
jgi:hypothetical protein